MKKVLVRYKVKPEKVDENESFIREVYKQLDESRIEGFHYCTLKLSDEVSFIHIAISDTEEANSKFSHMPAFKHFQSGIKDRCAELPIVSTVSIIGAYKFGLELFQNEFK